MTNINTNNEIVFLCDGDSLLLLNSKAVRDSARSLCRRSTVPITQVVKVAFITGSQTLRKKYSRGLRLRIYHWRIDRVL